MEKLKVLLVDDHAVVRLGLMTLLEDISWLEIVGEAGTADEAVTAVDETRPDVVLMDIRLPDDSGLSACAAITSRWPQTRVIMLTSYSDDSLIRQAKEAGASYYILKQVGNQALIEALEQLQQGGLDLDMAATRQSITKYHQVIRERSGDRFKGLSEREMWVLWEVTEGKTDAQIADDLGMLEETVLDDINSLVKKLEVDNRFEAAIYAVRNKIQFFLPEK